MQPLPLRVFFRSLKTQPLRQHPTWVPWSRDALSGWVELIRLGVGGAVGMWAEWWAAELMVFLCGILCTLREDPSAACDDVAVVSHPRIHARHLR